jgi:hypothetical protein
MRLDNDCNRHYHWEGDDDDEKEEKEQKSEVDVGNRIKQRRDADETKIETKATKSR